MRSDFYPKAMQYLFSVDLDLVGPGERPEQSAFSTRCLADVGSVYHALGEVQIDGRDTIAGTVRLIRERTTIRLEEKMGELSATLVIETEDNESIHAHCAGVFRSPGRFLLVKRDAAPKSADPLTAAQRREAEMELKAFISARFDSGATKYRWLTASQCVGYGRLHLTNGEPNRATFDFYALQ
jgi:hypothetical protein